MCPGHASCTNATERPFALRLPHLLKYWMLWMPDVNCRCAVLLCLVYCCAALLSASAGAVGLVVGRGGGGGVEMMVIVTLCVFKPATSQGQDQSRWGWPSLAVPQANHPGVEAACHGMHRNMHHIRRGAQLAAAPVKTCRCCCPCHRLRCCCLC
jgi:hypothetical protein